MIANIENIQYLTGQIRLNEERRYRFAVQLHNLEVDRIYNGRSTMHEERSLMHHIYQLGRELHSLKTKRGMLYKAMRDNQLNLIGE